MGAKSIRVAQPTNRTSATTANRSTGARITNGSIIARYSFRVRPVPRGRSVPLFLVFLGRPSAVLLGDSAAAVFAGEGYLACSREKRPYRMSLTKPFASTKMVVGQTFTP